MLELKPIIDKLIEIGGPKIQNLCNFICSKIWCYGDLVWDSHLSDLDSELEAFSNQELLNLGNKLIELSDWHSHVLLGWIISKSNRLTDIITCTGLSQTELECREQIKCCVAECLPILHAIAKYSESILLLQEALDAVNCLKQNIEVKQLAQKLTEKIEGLS